VVRLIKPHTEGDPVGVLGSMLAAFGNAVGRGPYVEVSATKHFANLYFGLVGKTSRGRKDSATEPVLNLMSVAAKDWYASCTASGLSSGEGVIHEIRCRRESEDESGRTKVIDPGVSDKRLMVSEGELAQALKVMRREGNTLSPVLRLGWDGKTLRTLVKNTPERATNPHLSILGHIIAEELMRQLYDIELANGFANRFVWLMVHRSQLLPFGGKWSEVNTVPIITRIAEALAFARERREVSFGKDAEEAWADAYAYLTQDRPDMFGAVTARAEAQTLRLAMLYALADRSPKIKKTHVEGAFALWRYSEWSTAQIFGRRIGDPDADSVLEALIATNGAGLSRTEVSRLFNGNRTAEEIDRIRETLSRNGRLRVAMVREEGGAQGVRTMVRDVITNVRTKNFTNYPRARGDLFVLTPRTVTAPVTDRRM